MIHTIAIYGQTPLALLPTDIAAHALQCAPTVVNAARLEDCPPESLEHAWVYAPSGTIERRHTLALALKALAIGGTLTALAPKDKGGSRVSKELQAFGCMVVETSRSHHRICTTTRPASLVGVEDAITAGGPQQHPTLGLWTQPGIFSWDRLDAGTALLLEHLPEFSGRGADLGCGLGILARAALTSPAITEITLVDNDRRAVEAATRNITDPRATFLWADARNEYLPLHDLDFVVMNPPFHDVGIEDKRLGQSFIERAASILKHGGVCWITANKHLPYEALLTTLFRRNTLISETNGYKIFAAEK
jgi:16S rRNA (guanine1207-N2)-methyltransferase